MKERALVIACSHQQVSQVTSTILLDNFRSFDFGFLIDMVDMYMYFSLSYLLNALYSYACLFSKDKGKYMMIPNTFAISNMFAMVNPQGSRLWQHKVASIVRLFGQLEDGSY